MFKNKPNKSTKEYFVVPLEYVKQSSKNEILTIIAT